MKYRSLASLDWKVPALGFGAMRLPVLNGDHAIIDEPESIQDDTVCHRPWRKLHRFGRIFYHRGNSEVLRQQSPARRVP